jgi:hypothetical protein
VVVADFNGDGRSDVAVAATYIDGPPPHAGYVEVYFQTATGVFTMPARYPIGPDPWGMSAGDVDSNGKLDLVVASPSTVPAKINVIANSGGVSVLRQDPANPGGFLASQWIATGGSATDVAVAQLDGGGLADLVVADGVTVNSRAVLLLQNPSAPGAFMAPTTLSTGGGGGSEDVAVADVNGDGLADIVLAATSSVVVFYQRAGGGFESPVLLTAGLIADGVAVADLDGDGRADIVVVNAGNAPSGGTGASSATILLQTSPGEFVASNITLPDGARRVAIGDLNGDRLPDIAALSTVYQAIGTPSKVSVLLQSSAIRGQFAMAATYDGATSSFVAIGDINGDGLNDIVVDDGPAVLLQRAGAPGTFAAVRALK